MEKLIKLNQHGYKYDVTIQDGGGQYTVPNCSEAKLEYISLQMNKDQTYPLYQNGVYQWTCTVAQLQEAYQQRVE